MNHCYIVGHLSPESLAPYRIYRHLVLFSTYLILLLYNLYFFSVFSTFNIPENFSNVKCPILAQDCSEINMYLYLDAIHRTQSYSYFPSFFKYYGGSGFTFLSHKRKLDNEKPVRDATNHF